MWSVLCRFLSDHGPPKSMKLSDFDYELPPEAIASEPARPRDTARLLDLTGADMTDRRISDLPAILKAEDLLVVNDTRVIPCLLYTSPSPRDRQKSRMPWSA